MRAQLVAAIRAVLVFTVVCGLAYPLAATVVAQLAMDGRADGSLIRKEGRVVGSQLIGQEFDGPEWFHPRPSAAGDGYDTTASGASNLGPSNRVLLDAVADRTRRYRADNDLAAGQKVPVDAVTSSGSGLDPHISIANARLQAERVARARKIPLTEVLTLIGGSTDGRVLGFLGEPGVNVVELNISLDELQ